MLTTLVGLLGGVGAALIGAWAALRARHPQKSRVELVDVSLSSHDPDKAVRDDLPVLDVKVRNTGGQPAVLKRVVVHTQRAVQLDSVWLTPYKPGFPRYIGARLDVSATYDVTLPVPKKAMGARVTIDISQVVNPREADRFLIRLGRSSINHTVAYLLQLELVYDANDRKVNSASLAVAFPQSVLIESAEQIRSDLHDFQEEVDQVRQAIDWEMAARGRPTPDWITASPQHRDELPDGLRSVDGDGNLLSSGFVDCVYVVNEKFWEPRRAIEGHLSGIEKCYRELVDVITSATVVHEVLRVALPSVYATLAQLPALRAEFCAPEKADTAGAPAQPGGSARTDQLARLLAQLRNLEELQARADNGDRKAAHVLHLTTRVTKLLEDRGPDDPKTLETRHLLAVWQGAEGDPAGAAEALTDLLPDLLRVHGPDHPETLRLRQGLAFNRGNAGDAAGAAEAFAELVPDLLRVHGPEHPDTLDARHELARWRGETGDAAGAAAAFAELVPDRVQVQGPDHPHTLLARHHLARLRGEAGDAAGAAAAFAELVPDRLRVLGPDHPDTLASQRALAYWQDQARDLR